MTKQIYITDENDSGIRIDSYLSTVYENLSRTKIQSQIKSGTVLVNGKSCKPSYVISPDDKIVCEFSDVETIKIEPENIELDIRYEDDNYAIINKPSGMLTHPTSTEKNGTLVNALLYKFEEHLSDINGEYRRGIVHRLDRNTSGLLVIAKNNLAHEKFAQMIKDRTVEKHYRAIVKGVMNDDITINEPIGRSKSQPNKMCVSPDGKPSLTVVKVLERFSDSTYIDVDLKTGRTHQIRVHLSHINHPVFNDTMYGYGKMKIRTDEQVLQSYKLKFENPFDNKVIEIEIEPDEKIMKVLNYLKNKNK